MGLDRREQQLQLRTCRGSALLSRQVLLPSADPDLPRQNLGHLPAGPGDLEPADAEPWRARQPRRVHPEQRRKVHVPAGRLHAPQREHPDVRIVDAAVALDVYAAGLIDQEVEGLTPAFVEEVLKNGNERMLRRSLHRKDHLDKIEKALS